MTSYPIKLLAGALALSAGAGAWAADTQFKLLVLAIPNKYHYEYVPIARESLEKMAKLHAFEFTYTNKPEVFDGDLKQYAAVMFLNTPGTELSPKQRANFEAYMQGGGNAVLVHRATIVNPTDAPNGYPKTWEWYDKLIGRKFKTHPMVQTAAVDTVDKRFPATYGLPQRWIWSDEWYETTNPYNVAIHPVLNVDESTYDVTKIWPGQVSTGMGKEHPVAWYHQVEKGRVFVTLLGHNGEMYRDPQYLAHLWGGIWWAALGKGAQ
jgi:type 1 glutamine amidotransferase